MLSLPPLKLSGLKLKQNILQGKLTPTFVCRCRNQGQNTLKTFLCTLLVSGYMLKLLHTLLAGGYTPTVSTNLAGRWLHVYSFYAPCWQVATCLLNDPRCRNTLEQISQYILFLIANICRESQCFAAKCVRISLFVENT